MFDNTENTENIDNNNDAKKRRNRNNNDAPMVATNPNMSLEDVVAMLPASLVCMRNAKGIVEKNGILMIKCVARRHIHDQYVSDICEKKDKLTCTACSYGDKFAKRVHIIVEDILGQPFVRYHKTHINGNYEFINPVLHVIISINSFSGETPYADIGGNRVIIFHRTQSTNRIKSILREGLKGVLPDNMRESVNAQCTTAAEKRREIRGKRIRPKHDSLLELDGINLEDCLYG